MPFATIALRAWNLLTDTQQTQARNLSISPQQLEYAGSSERQIQSVEAESGAELVGLAILNGNAVVGFLVLKRGAKAPHWAAASAAVISGMRIDQSQQGRGLGSKALLALPSWVEEHWPGCTALALSVDEANVQGIRAYSAAGFMDQGTRVQGRIGWVRSMSKPLHGRAAGTESGV